MTTNLTPTPKFKAFDNNGVPLNGGLLYTYQSGTTTPLATYTDATGATPNANPVVLNSRGEASVFLGSAAYTLLLKDSLGNVIWQVDGISVPVPITGYTTGGGTADVTLPLPMTLSYTIAISVGGKKVILPAANLPNSIPLGVPIFIQNTGSQAWQLVLQDTVTNLVTSVAVGATAIVALASNATANGSWISFSIGSVGSLNVGLYLKASAGSLQVDPAQMSVFGGEQTIASAATVDLGTATVASVTVTGNTGITSLGTPGNNSAPWYFVRLQGTPLFTNSGNLICPGAVNYQGAAGDLVICEYIDASVWRIWPQLNSGKSVVATVLTPNSISSTPGDPTGNASATAVMMGLNVPLTPAFSGRVLAIVNGDAQNSGGAGSIGAKMQLRWGTGTAPVNGAALTGTAVGGQVINLVAAAAQSIAFGLNSVISGLSLATAIWVDVSVASANGAGTASIKNLSVSLVEIR